MGISQENGVFPSMCEKSVFQYITSGQYVNDANGAMGTIDNCLISTILNDDGSDTVRLDIDETTLSNFLCFNTFQHHPMLHEVDAWNHWVEKAKSP